MKQAQRGNQMTDQDLEALDSEEDGMDDPISHSSGGAKRVTFAAPQQALSEPSPKSTNGGFQPQQTSFQAHGSSGVRERNESSRSQESSFGQGASFERSSRRNRHCDTLDPDDVDLPQSHSPRERMETGSSRSERSSRREGSSSRSRREKDRMPRMDESNKQMVAQLRELSSRLEGRCTKFPTSGGGLLGFSKERYVAVLPFDELEGQVSFRDQTQGLSWNRQLGLWRRGMLGWWISQEHFRREEEPKGGIPLMSISKVEWDEMTHFDVSVRHKDKETNSTQELVLQFPSEQRAKEWRDTLHHIRSLLQETVMRV